jgi:hypothetical protein
MMIWNLIHSVDISQPITILLLYGGPDQILPLVSIIGTIIGFLLIMWRRLVMFMSKMWGKLSRSSQPSADVKPAAKLEATAKD